MLLRKHRKNPDPDTLGTRFGTSWAASLLAAFLFYSGGDFVVFKLAVLLKLSGLFYMGFPIRKVFSAPPPKKIGQVHIP